MTQNRGVSWRLSCRKIRLLKSSGSSWKSGRDPGGCWDAAGWGFIHEKPSKDEGNSFLEQLPERILRGLGVPGHSKVWQGKENCWDLYPNSCHSRHAIPWRAFALPWLAWDVCGCQSLGSAPCSAWEMCCGQAAKVFLCKFPFLNWGFQAWINLTFTGPGECPFPSCLKQGPGESAFSRLFKLKPR